MRPEGKNKLQIVSVSPLVSRLRIEQSDYVVPLSGPNPNRVFADGDPYSFPELTFDLSGVKDIKFTVFLGAGVDRCLLQAVMLRWVQLKWGRVEMKLAAHHILAVHLSIIKI